jgi:hypothetical protein
MSYENCLQQKKGKTFVRGVFVLCHVSQRDWLEHELNFEG